MFIASSKNTERGIMARNYSKLQAERQERVNRQRELYEARMAEAAAIAAIRRAAAEQAEAVAAEMRARGYRHQHSYREIERRACKLFDVTRAEIYSSRRHADIVFVRQFIAYWAARLTPHSLPQIGRLMGGKDHTTVLHNRDKYPEKRSRMGRVLPPAR